METSQKGVIIVPQGWLMETSAADVFTWIVQHPIRITDFGFVVTELTAIDNTDFVASLDATQITPTVARAEKGTVTITDAVAVGVEVIASEDFSTWAAFSLDEGDTLICEAKTAGVDASTEAGEGYFTLYYELIPDGTY